jgi:hypothetical protein
MLNNPIQEVKLVKRNLNQKCREKVKVVVGLVAIADSVVATVDIETSAMRAEVMVAIETAVAIVKEEEIEAMGAVVTSQVGQKFPLFPKVRPKICCQTISGFRTSTIKDIYSSIALILEFSTPIEKLNMRLSEASRPNLRLLLEFISLMDSRYSHQLKATKYCSLMLLLAEILEIFAFHPIIHSRFLSKPMSSVKRPKSKISWISSLKLSKMHWESRITNN